MINCNLENLGPERDKALRSYLADPRFEVLLEVIDSQTKAFAVEYMTNAVLSEKHPDKRQIAEEKLKDAQRWAMAADKLKQLASQHKNEPYKTVKLT